MAPDAGLDGPLGQVAVADHLAAPGVVLEVGVVVDPGGDLGLDGLGEHAPGPVPEELGEDVLAGGQGHDADVGGRLDSWRGTPRPRGPYGVLVTVASPRIPRRPSTSRPRLSVIPPSTGINIDCSRPSKKIGQPLLKAPDSLLQLRKRVLAACSIRVAPPQFLQLQGCLVGPLRTEAAQRGL